MLIKHSNTSNILRFTLKNSSTGIGLTGLTNASAGLIIAIICNNEATTTVYTQAASNIETIAALGTYAAPTANKCRFKEVDATNHKGLYEFQFANARFAIASARSMAISVTGAASLLDADYEIQLVSFDPHDSVRMGLTAMPNAAADGAGGLPISDAGGLDLDTKLANAHEITAARMGALTDWINGGRLDLLLDAIPTTAMRGTDNAALASVLGALNDAASDGDPTAADTLMKYIKQLINILVGTAGIVAFPAEAGPANAISLAEVIRAIHADVTGLNGSAMVGTNGANTTVPDAAGVAPTAVEIQAEMEENGASILDTLRDDLADGGRLDLLIDAIKAQTDLVTAARMGALTDWINGGRLDLILDIIAADTTTDIPAKLLKYVQLLARSDAAIATDNVTELTAINADGGSGAGDFSNQTDAEEAIRDRGDSAWTTGAGGSDRLLMVDTTIATLASQTSFTLAAGSADDNAYNNCTIIIEDVSTAAQKAVGIISDYIGATKTITLKYDPAIFTMATTDKVYILAENALKSTLANRQLNVAADGDIAGNIDGSVASVVGHTVQTGDGYAILNNGTHGNAALETLVDEIETILKNATYGNSALQVLVAALQTDLDNGTDGLGALKTLIDTVNTDLSNGTDGLGALKTLIDTVNTDLSNGTDGLGALKALIDTIDGVVDTILVDTNELRTNQGNWATATGFSTHDAAAVKTAIEAAGSKITLIKAQTDLVTAARMGALTDWIDGGRLDLLIDAIKAKSDNLPSGIAKNVALSSFTFFMVLTSDHVTAATGKTITGQISKDGGAFVGLTNSITEIGNGLYKTDIIQAEMNADIVALKFTETDCDQRVVVIYTA